MYTKKTQKPDKFFCIPCNIRITRKNMTEHLKTKHSTMKTYKCALCKCDFLYQKSRTSHMRIVHSDDYRCLQCNVQFITSSLYAKHMKENHNEIVPLSIEFNEVIDVPSDKLLFVQDNTSGKVMQAAISLTPNSIKDENGNEQVVSVYPNPFTNTTNVIVSLASTQEVKVDVFNLVGEKVYSVNQGQMAAGVHSVIVDGTSLSSGMYFVNVTAGEKTYTKKVTLNK